jgi:spoIIIJ-associated protein
MEWIEVTGRTLDEAVERALDSLGVHDTELDYQVLAEPKNGFLGLGRTEARIRARVKPRSREKPNDKRRRTRDEQRARRRNNKERPATETVAASPGARNGQTEQPARTGASAGAGSSDAASNGATSGSGAKRRRRRSRGSGGGGSQQNGATATATAPQPAAAYAVATSHEEPRSMERSGSIEEQVSAGREFATGLLDAFEAQGSVSVEPEDNEIEVRIDGDNLGLLVGPKGATLAALEELLRGAVGHRGPGRLHLDVAGYRAKRRTALAEFTRRVAADVQASGAAKALEPMSAPDRKVVHDTVSEIDGVSTISDGEEPRRRVIIQPA